MISVREYRNRGSRKIFCHHYQLLLLDNIDERIVIINRHGPILLLRSTDMDEPALASGDIDKAEHFIQGKFRRDAEYRVVGAQAKSEHRACWENIVGKSCFELAAVAKIGGEQGMLCFHGIKIRGVKCGDIKPRARGIDEKRGVKKIIVPVLGCGERIGKARVIIVAIEDESKVNVLDLIRGHCPFCHGRFERGVERGEIGVGGEIITIESEPRENIKLWAGIAVV